MQMGIIFESEVSNEGIVRVLQHVQQYLSKDDEEEKITIVEQGLVGDQLIIERAVKVHGKWIHTRGTLGRLPFWYC